MRRRRLGKQKKDELICPMCSQVVHLPRKKVGKLTVLIKTCNVCGETKLTTEFYRCPRNKDGFKGTCKSCTNRHAKIVREMQKQDLQGKKIMIN